MQIKNALSITLENRGRFFISDKRQNGDDVYNFQVKRMEVT